MPVYGRELWEHQLEHDRQLQLECTLKRHVCRDLDVPVPGQLADIEYQCLRYLSLGDHRHDLRIFAQLVDGGTTSITGSIIVSRLTVTSGAKANSVASPSDGVAYDPAQILSAYGISNLGLDGTGQTIAIVDAYDDPDILQAVDAFDSQFGLTGSGPTLYQQYGPASSFLTVLNQNGQATPLPETDPSGPGTDNWEVEESLDVEWAHAVAPVRRLFWSRPTASRSQI